MIPLIGCEGPMPVVVVGQGLLGKRMKFYLENFASHRGITSMISLFHLLDGAMHPCTCRTTETIKCFRPSQMENRNCRVRRWLLPRLTRPIRSGDAIRFACKVCPRRFLVSKHDVANKDAAQT